MQVSSNGHASVSATARGTQERGTLFRWYYVRLSHVRQTAFIKNMPISEIHNSFVLDYTMFYLVNISRDCPGERVYYYIHNS